MKGDRTPTALLCDLVLQLKYAADLAAGSLDHSPGQFCYFGRAKAGPHREKNDKAIAQRMPRALGEKQEIVDMISR
jgi:hypothetical protein